MWMLGWAVAVTIIFGIASGKPEGAAFGLFVGAIAGLSSFLYAWRMRAR